MPITADFHLHTSFSGDSDTPMEEMILRGIELGLTEMCFTEHNDFDFPVSDAEPADFWELNPDAYLYDFLKLREKYADRISLLYGVELGLQPHLSKKNAAFAKEHDYDFIIGSSHICHGRDPYYFSFYEGRSQEEAYLEYFESILENLKSYSNFDVYGHLDYVVRYGPAKDDDYSYERYQEIFDAILTKLVDMEKGIEVNTAGLAKGIRDVHPCRAVLRRFRELGGEIVTVGSDAHEPQQIAHAFDRAAGILKDCGFGYYATYEKRSPSFHKL
ncbi:MAG: histidinol-phosphatase HisJ family protein [Bacteroidales bacterium]|nr:histidinol-phosphatase HisJ family protein [Bacteroidales bacterium]MCM1415311.1 histidinol-phosphatase HisJ family protein [bacterium]MCM1423466.1 histidinol-phosphatase HisJ family protein [bacterium]